MIKMDGKAIGHACTKARNQCAKNKASTPANNAVNTPDMSNAMSNDMTSANNNALYFFGIFNLFSLIET